MNLDQMRKDWADFWATTPPGTSIPWAGGTLSVLADGSAIWGDGVAPMGLTFNRDTPFEVIAGRSQAIADLWKAQYGYVPPPLAATGAVFG